MYGICINPPWGFGFGVWKGKAFNRLGATVTKGSVALLDLGTTQPETNNNTLGLADSGFANARAVAAAGQAYHPRVVLLDDSVADNALGTWALAMCPIPAKVGTTLGTGGGATTSALDGAALIVNPSKVFFDIHQPQATGASIVLTGFAFQKVAAILLEDTPTFTANDESVLLNVALDGWAGFGTFQTLTNIT